MTRDERMALLRRAGDQSIAIEQRFASSMELIWDLYYYIDETNDTLRILKTTVAFTKWLIPIGMGALFFVLGKVAQ